MFEFRNGWASIGERAGRTRIVLQRFRDVVNLPNYGESKVGEGVGLGVDDALSHAVKQQEFLLYRSASTQLLVVSNGRKHQVA